MRNVKNIIHNKILYIFFIFLSLNLFFFSTEKVYSKSFDIKNIEISRPFEINFNKNDIINDGFRKAFFELLLSIISSSDFKKINKIKLNKIKGMIESFSIKEEKFINETYFVNLGVSFDKKKIFKYLEEKNIFPSAPVKRDFLFIPIIIDEKNNDLLIFNNNKIFTEWNYKVKKYHLIQYILPSEDLEDISTIKSRYESIEEYDFKDITNKYNLENSIIALIFRDKKKVRILSRITNKQNILLKNQSFSNFDLEDIDQVKRVIDDLKIIYEDYWKNFNKINTSIKLNLEIKINNQDYSKISNFEKTLNNYDLIYNYFISRFDKDFTEYKVIFNGTPDTFLREMSDKNYSFDTQNRVWILK